MAEVMPAYVRAAETLRLAARQAALTAVDGDAAGEALDELYRSIDAGALVHAQAPSGLGAERGEEAEVLLGGVLAAHAVVAREALDPSAARLILPALWSNDTNERLEAARVAEQVLTPGRMTDGVLKLLRVSGTSHRVAASGQLARDVVRSGPEGYAQAWYGVHGERLLAGRRASRLAAVGMVRAGAVKSQVAAHGSLSRTTLDGWLAE